jgi:GT2 family glycosyltransferase
MSFQDYYETALRLGWFDACFYFDLLQSEGVSIRATEVSLFEHYATVGYTRGLSPSVRFSVARYLAEYPDVADSQVDPLYHYLVRGKRERRKAFALFEWPANVNFAGTTGSRRFARSILEAGNLPVLFLCQGTGKVGLFAALGQAGDIDCFAIVDGEAEPNSSCFGLHELDAFGWSREQKADYLAELLAGCGDLVVVSDSLATADLLEPFAVREHRIVSFLQEAPDTTAPGAAIRVIRWFAHRIVASSDGLRDQISLAFTIPGADIQVVRPPAQPAPKAGWERYLEDVGACLRGLGNDGSRVRTTGTTRGRQEVADDLCVVIPSYNHRDYVMAAVDSILAQSLRPGEIRIIDDGSSDGSAELVRSLTSEKLGISVRTRENRGAGATINEGVADTTCPIVAIMNSDDLWHPLRIEQLIGELRQGGGADVVFSRLRFTGSQHRCAQKRDWYERGVADYRNGTPLWLVLMSFNLFFTTSNLIARRDKFLEVGGFGPLRYCHDLDYMLKAIVAGHRMRFVEQTLCEYRLHDRNTIDEDWAKVLFEDAWIIAKFLRRTGGQLGDAERLSVAKRVCAKGLAGRVQGMLAILARDPQPFDDATLHADPRLAGVCGHDGVEPAVFMHNMAELVSAVDAWAVPE